LPALAFVLTDVLFDSELEITELPFPVDVTEIQYWVPAVKPVIN
jgi:hypothetical protein